MKITKQIVKHIIKEELKNFLEAYESDREEKQEIDKDKQNIQKQKLDFDQKKFDFQKKQADVSNRQTDKRDAEKEKKEQERGTGTRTAGGGGEQDAPKPNINFKTQGEFYQRALSDLANLQLSNKDLLDDDEKHYIALAVQSAEGRFDKGFKKFLQKGRAGNIYGKDFSDQDIKIIMDFCREHDIVR